ncbi:BTB/POZ domain-containing protein 2 [Balamuthia mandrillaris]
MSSNTPTNKRKLPEEFGATVNELQRWREDLLQSLARMVDNTSLADVRFLVGPGAVPVHASRMFHSLRSPVFQAMFMGPFKEGLPTPSIFDGEPAMTVVRLPEVQPETFRDFLHLLHTNKLPETATEATKDKDVVCRHLIDIFAVADQFMVPQAKALIGMYLTAKYLTKQNIFWLLEESIVSTRDLIPVLVRYISKHASELLLFEEKEEETRTEVETQWLALSVDAVLAILDGDLEGLAEIQVFEAVRRWCQVEHRTAEDKRRVLKGIVLQLLSARELAEKVDASGLFTDNQMKEALKQHILAYRMEVDHPFKHTTNAPSGLHRFPSWQHNKLTWHIALEKQGGKLSLAFLVDQFQSPTAAVNKVSLAGIQLQVYRNRKLVFSARLANETEIPVGQGGRVHNFSCSEEGRFTVLVDIPGDLFK